MSPRIESGKQASHQPRAPQSPFMPTWVITWCYWIVRTSHHLQSRLCSFTTKSNHHKFDGICCFPKSVSFSALTCCKSNMMKALSWIATLKGAKLEVPCILHEGQFRFFKEVEESNNNIVTIMATLKTTNWRQRICEEYLVH